MESSSEELAQKDEHSTFGHRTLLILAAVALCLSAVALALSSIDAALGSSTTFPSYQNGWSVGSMVFMYAGSAIYPSSVLLGLAALTLAQSKATQRRAAKMARPLLVLGVVVIMVGIGRTACEVGSDYAQLETLGWPTAQTVFRLLGRLLLQAGTLAGLAYLCRQQAGAAQPPAGKLD